MRFLRMLSAGIVGLVLAMFIMPHLRPWKDIIVAKAAGGNVQCEWGKVASLPWDLDSWVSIRHKAEQEVAVAEEDKAAQLMKVSTPGRAFWTKSNGSDLDGKNLIAFLIAERAWGTKIDPDFDPKPGDVVMDVGAHVGVFADHALRKGASKVILVEPDPANVECIRRNFAKEMAEGKVVLVAEGAWSKESTLDFTIGVSNSGTGSLVNREAGGKTIQVPVRPIDDMLARLKMDKVDYIKMDIEGAEREALKGAAKTIAQFRPRLFLDANHLADDHQVLPPLIRNLNAKYQLATGGCEYNVNNGGVYTPHTNYYF